MACFIIPPEEISFMPNSYIDPNGRVFEWRGELYRSLTSTYTSFFEELFEKDVIQSLIRDGIVVESEITDFSLQPGDFVLRHRKIPVISYCFEWPAAMLKEAALVTIQLCIRLADQNLTLQDGHPWNILFDGTKPIFIDIGSIVPAREDLLWSPYQQFCNFFLFPLYLYSVGQDRLARWLLHDYMEGVTDGDLLAILPLRYQVLHPRRTLKFVIPRLLAKIVDRLPLDLQNKIWTLSRKVNTGLVNSKFRHRFFESLHSEVESIKLPLISSYWKGYYNNPSMAACSASTLPAAEWQMKKETVARLLAELCPRTVLDLGCNTGYYASLAASNGSRVIACDKDPASVEQCYNEARKKRTDVLPLVSNGFNPAPAYGWGARECPSTVERFRSELVLALAIIHHVVAHERMGLKRLIDICHEYSDRRLLIEYVPPMDRRIGTTPLPPLDSYTLDTMAEILRQRFPRVISFASFPQERKLFLCEK